MGWAKLTDTRADNPKLMAAGFAARGLDEAAICWVAGHETDGIIPKTAVAMLAAGHGANWKPLVKKLVDVGRWIPKTSEGAKEPDAWEIHDYLEYNPTKAQREAERERKRAAGHLGGIRSGESRRGGTEAEAEAETKQPASEPANSRPVPSRPDPDISKSSSHLKPLAAQVGEEDDDPKTAELGAQIAEICTGDNRVLVNTEARAVASWALNHVDPRLVEEAIGSYSLPGHEQPILPRWVAGKIRLRATDYSNPIPEFVP